jgi:GNAT superfamily N-acetyltransferase
VLQAALEEHLAAAPIFWEHELGDTAAWLRDPVNALWLAEDSRGILGCLGIGPGANCTLVEEDGTAAIVSAFTWAQARGQGVATALLNRALAWARTEGYERCAVDWEPMNYLASRFWTRWFTPVCFSLLRHVLRASVREEEDRRR